MTQTECQDQTRRMDLRITAATHRCNKARMLPLLCILLLLVPGVKSKSCDECASLSRIKMIQDFSCRHCVEMAGYNVTSPLYQPQPSSVSLYLEHPSASPTVKSTNSPSATPSQNIILLSTNSPSETLSASPSQTPTTKSSEFASPSHQPTVSASGEPSTSPTNIRSISSSNIPSFSYESNTPTLEPAGNPNFSPLSQTKTSIPSETSKTTSESSSPSYTPSNDCAEEGDSGESSASSQEDEKTFGIIDPAYPQQLGLKYAVTTTSALNDEDLINIIRKLDREMAIQLAEDYGVYYDESTGNTENSGHTGCRRKNKKRRLHNSSRRFKRRLQDSIIVGVGSDPEDSMTDGKSFQN